MLSQQNGLGIACPNRVGGGVAAQLLDNRRRERLVEGTLRLSVLFVKPIKMRQSSRLSGAINIEN